MFPHWGCSHRAGILLNVCFAVALLKLQKFSLPHPSNHLTLLSFSIITAAFDLQQLYHKVALVTEGNLLFSGMMLTEQVHITEIRWKLIYLPSLYLLLKLQVHPVKIGFSSGFYWRAWSSTFVSTTILSKWMEETFKKLTSKWCVTDWEK